MVIMYPEVAFRKQILTFTIIQIFLRISNPQHVSPSYNIPPWTVIVSEDDQLKKHQVNLMHKQFERKKVFYFL